jgi:hypothetical protein
MDASSVLLALTSTGVVQSVIKAVRETEGDEVGGQVQVLQRQHEQNATAAEENDPEIQHEEELEALDAAVAVADLTEGGEVGGGW